MKHITATLCLSHSTIDFFQLDLQQLEQLTKRIIIDMIEPFERFGTSILITLLIEPMQISRWHDGFLLFSANQQTLDQYGLPPKLTVIEEQLCCCTDHRWFVSCC